VVGSERPVPERFDQSAKQIKDLVVRATFNGRTLASNMHH